MNEIDFGTWLPTFQRKVYLGHWVSVDKRKPKKGQCVWICDADWRGIADYELSARYNGKNFIDKRGNPVQGVTYWQNRIKWITVR